MGEEHKEPDTIIIGRVVKPHGVKGALKIEPITDDPGRFNQLKRVFLGSDSICERVVTIKKVQFQAKYVILTLDEITTRDAALDLGSKYLHIPLTETMPLPEGAYYYYQLIGLKVITENNQVVGVLKDVRTYPAHDLLVVKNKEREILVPDNAEFVKEINLEKGVIVIHAIDGLLE